MGQNQSPRIQRAIALLVQSGFTVSAATAAIEQSAPAARTFYTPAEVKAGIGFPCTAGCSRVLKTEKRASIHGIELGGHAPKA